MSWKDGTFIALDTETTGLDFAEDRVIQIGMSFFSAGKFLGTNAWDINSGRPSAEDAIATHGITDERQFAAEEPERILPLIPWALVEAQFLVIMNAPFDLNFLLAEFDRLGKPLAVEIPYVLDPLVIDRFYSKNRIPPYSRGKRTLKAMSERYGIHDYPLHDAGHDSRRVGELMIEMANHHGQLARCPLSELHKKQRKWHREWCDEFAGFADAKGFVFNRTDWPHRKEIWQPELTDPLPLD